MQQTNNITQEGLSKLQAELAKLRAEDRPKAVERLSTARGMGDLAENSEYTAAREELRFLDSRLIEIETQLRTVKVIASNGQHEAVGIGNEVTVLVDGTKQTYTLVGDLEADISVGKLSEKSPIGRALMGKKVGEIVTIDVPAGSVEYKIVEIK